MNSETAKLLRFALVLAVLLLAVSVVGMEREKWSSVTEGFSTTSKALMATFATPQIVFQCPPTIAELRKKLSGRTVASLNFRNGEVACFVEHVAKKLKMVDSKGRF